MKLGTIVHRGWLIFRVSRNLFVANLVELLGEFMFVWSVLERFSHLFQVGCHCFLFAHILNRVPKYESSRIFMKQSSFKQSGPMTDLEAYQALES